MLLKVVVEQLEALDELLKNSVDVCPVVVTEGIGAIHAALDQASRKEAKGDSIRVNTNDLEKLLEQNRVLNRSLTQCQKRNTELVLRDREQVALLKKHGIPFNE